MEVAKLPDNTYFSRKSYMKILRNNVFVEGKDYPHVEVENEHGAIFQIPHGILEREDCDSASQYGFEKKASRTQIVKAIRNAGDSVFTVNFNKKVKGETVEEEIMSLYANSNGKIISKEAFKAMAKRAAKAVQVGEERTMVCKLCDVDDEFGMFQVIDLEEKYEPKPLKDGTGVYDNRWRQVIQLNINWAIVKGVKYIADK
jgi:hypothetical protein